MEAHSHPFHELIVIVSGDLSVEIHGQTIQAGPGETLWYPQGVSHREWTNPKTPAETFFIGFECPNLVLPVIHQPDSQGRIQSLARWLYADREMQAASPSTITGNAFLRAILAEYHRLTTCRENSFVTRIRAYMHRNLSISIPLDALAAYAQLSKYHFVRRYKTLTGRTPMQELQHLRIQAARDLLLTTNLPLKEIGPRTGLGDQYHLSRLFQTHFKIPPGTMRRGRTR